MKITSAADTSTQTVSGLLMDGAGAASSAGAAAAASAGSISIADGGAASAGASATGVAGVSVAGSWARATPVSIKPHSAVRQSACTRVRHPESNRVFMVTSEDGLERIGVDLAGADADDLFDRADEDLSVADLAGGGGLLHGFERRLEHVVGDGAFDLQLRQEVDDVFRAAIQLGVPLLATEALDLGHGNPGHADFGERLAHLVELERADDGGDQFHLLPPVWCDAVAAIRTPWRA